jgi:hypothetical protein
MLNKTAPASFCDGLVGGDGEAIEYAVSAVALAQSLLLSESQIPGPYNDPTSPSQWNRAGRRLAARSPNDLVVVVRRRL